MLLSITAAAAGPVGPAHAETPATAPAQGQPYKILQERPDRLIVQLPNGLIAVAQSVRAAPVVSANVFVKTGSIYEQEHVGAGLSHFLEHLLSAGSTSTRSEEESNAILGRIGAQTNASTSLDTVHYYINTTRPYATTAVELLSDWMQNSLISEVEYQRERDVIQREFDMGSGEPGRIFWKLTQQARYRAHPARHPTIGYLDEFQAISRDRIYDFYKRMYVPNNIVFAVAGDIEPRKVVDEIAQLWRDAKPGNLPEVSLPIEPEIDGPRTLSGTADMDKPRLRLAWPGTKLAGPDDYAMDLLAVILGQGESSRLVETVRDETRLVNNIVAYNLSFAWGEGFFAVDSEVAVLTLPETENVDAQELQDISIRQARGVILALIETLAENGVTPAELARAKRQTLAHTIYGVQTAQAMASRIADDLINTGDPDYLKHYAEAIQKITAEEIQAAAVKFLKPERLMTVTLLPQPQGAKAAALTRPADEVDVKALPREPVTLDNSALVARMQRAIASEGPETQAIAIEPIERVVLPNGLRVLVGRSTLVPAVSIQVYQAGGLLADQPGREGVANAVAMMLAKGTTNRTAQEIAQQVEDLGAELSPECGNNTSYVRAECLKQDWPTVLELVADVMLSANFPEDQWSILQPRLLAAIAGQTDTWGGELRKAFRGAYFGDHPWSQTPLGRREVVEKLTREDLMKYHQAHLRAAQTVLVVVGDVDPPEVVARVKELFGGMPSGEALEAPQPQAPTSRLVQVKTNKPLAAVQMGFGPGMARTSEDFAGMQVLVRVLSDFPTGWLEQELRGRGPGLVYAVGAGQFTGKVPGYFAVSFNTQPKSVPEALARSVAVIGRARTELVDEATLARAKAGVLTDEFLSKQSNGDRGTEAALNEMYGLPLDEAERFLKRVQSVDAAEVRRLAQKYLRVPVTVVLTHEEVEEAKLHEALKGAAAE